MRICSLLPSATEIVFALGLGDSLVGVSHECDFPAAAARLPKVTRSTIPRGVSSRQIDAAVSSALRAGGSLYELDLPLLEFLNPDLILTQKLCNVCAVSFGMVEAAAKHLPSRPKVLNLEPQSLDGIFENVGQVADAAGTPEKGRELVNSLAERVESVRAKTANVPNRMRVFCMEWVDPPYCGGHWMNELVEIAGGRDELARLHRPSVRIEWEAVLEFAPEVLILACCGFDLERCAEEAAILAGFRQIQDLPAVQAGRVYATDASHFFSRPGPRIVDSLEILAHLIHPRFFAPPPLANGFKPLTLGKSTPASTSLS